MSYVSQYGKDKDGEVIFKGKLPHPRELQYSIEPERFRMMVSAIKEEHPKWTVQECENAVIADLNRGVLGHITNLPPPRATAKARA